jgi:NTE family protein
MKEAKVGLALGAGSARGYAHLGVLKVFEKEGIRVDAIAGTSMGALVGGLYACGYELNILLGLAKSLRLRHIIDLSVSAKGLIGGEKIGEILKLLFHDRKIEDLKIPFACVATDICTGAHYVFNKGSLYEAVRASIAIPGIFPLMEYQGALLCDGAVVERVPVKTVKSLGADLVIAVDVAGYENRRPSVKNMFDIIFQAGEIMEKRIEAFYPLEADIVIKPNVGQFNANRFNKVSEIVYEGEVSAREVVPVIKNKIAFFKTGR